MGIQSSQTCELALQPLHQAPVCSFRVNSPLHNDVFPLLGDFQSIPSRYFSASPSPAPPLRIPPSLQLNSWINCTTQKPSKEGRGAETRDNFQVAKPNSLQDAAPWPSLWLGVLEWLHPQELIWDVLCSLPGEEMAPAQKALVCDRSLVNSIIAPCQTRRDIFIRCSAKAPGEAGGQSVVSRDFSGTAWLRLRLHRALAEPKAGAERWLLMRKELCVVPAASHAQLAQHSSFAQVFSLKKR